MYYNQRGEEREKGVESLFKEIIPENVLKLGRNLDIQGCLGGTVG